jgi:hypothetical protein
LLQLIVTAYRDADLMSDVLASGLTCRFGQLTLLLDASAASLAIFRKSVRQHVHHGRSMLKRV